MKFPQFNTAPLKAQLEEQPLVAAGVGAAVIAAVAKLVNANTARKNANTWKREVKRREKK